MTNTRKNWKQWLQSKKQRKEEKEAKKNITITVKYRQEFYLSMCVYDTLYRNMLFVIIDNKNSSNTCKQFLKLQLECVVFFFKRFIFFYYYNI